MNFNKKHSDLALPHTSLPNIVCFDCISLKNSHFLNSITFLSRGIVILIHIAKKQGKHFQSWLRICLEKLVNATLLIKQVLCFDKL